MKAMFRPSLSDCLQLNLRRISSEFLKVRSDGRNFGKTEARPKLSAKLERLSLVKRNKTKLLRQRRFQWVLPRIETRPSSGWRASANTSF
jgi:hypothetical protein